MRVFTFSQWQYEGDVFACQICDEEKGVMYIIADKLEDYEGDVEEKVAGLIDTPLGQRCGECLAQTLAELMPYVRLDATRLNTYKQEENDGSN